MRYIIFGALMLAPLQGWAMTDFIAPGTPETVGQGGALLGAEPNHPIPAPRGVFHTLGLPEGKPPPTYTGPRITRAYAKSRIEQAGYHRVIDLLEDERGGWQGRAEKNGHAMEVHCTGAGVVSAD